MDYNAAHEEDDMAKMNMEDVAQIVRHERDEKGLSWDEIAQKLKKLGHFSKRTQKPLSGPTVRYYYYYRKGMKDGANGNGEVKRDLQEQTPGPSRKLELIKNVIDLKTSAEGRIELIRSILAGA